MEGYKLQEDEVVLFKGEILFLGQTKRAVLIYTNKNLIFLDDNKVVIDIYPATDIKIWQGVPQIKTKGKLVELYLKTTEKEFEFVVRSDINKFITEVTNILTNSTKAERNANKIKETIALVDDTLNIDSVHEAGEFIKTSGINKLTNAVKGVGKNAISVGKGIGSLLKKKK